MAKLVDILAKEMDVWPWPQCSFLGQASDGSLHPVNECGGSVFAHTPEKYEICDDYLEEVVSTLEWQEAKAALNAKPSVLVPWTGVGLPPVGTKVVVCNLDGHYLPKSLEDWRDGDIVECISHSQINGYNDELSPVFFNKSRWSFSALREDCFTTIKNTRTDCRGRPRKCYPRNERHWYSCSRQVG